MHKVEIPASLLRRLEHPTRPLVILTCGIAGSGKSTFAKALTQLSSTQYSTPLRLSIDQYVWDHHGQYSVDYHPEIYESLQDEAEEANKNTLLEWIEQGRCAVLDYSFWSRETRDEYRTLIESKGGEVQILHLDIPRDTLVSRLAERAKRRDADAAFEIDKDTLERYIQGFERPDEDEGAIVVGP